MQLKVRLLPGRYAQDQRWQTGLLAAVGILLLLMLTLLIFWTVSGGGSEARWDRCNVHQADMEVNALPPVPDSDEKMLLALFKHLTQPNPMACKRNAWLGGEPMFRTNLSAMMWGMKHACFDPEFHMADQECLVYSMRQARDASFDAGAEAFGCETHSFGAGGERPRVHHHPLAADNTRNPLELLPTRLDSLVSQLGHVQTPVGYLAASADGAALEALAGAAPRALRYNVRQLGIRLDLRALTTGVWGVWPEESGKVPPKPAPPRDLQGLRQLYSNVLLLQQMKFYPFAFDTLDSADVGSFEVEGLIEPVPDQFEVVWLKTGCV